ncbi:hypothetical protein ANTHELSMS3_02286 [Antarctobacter heliothermus]|uniref:Uncharacterized protein n=2 Tax=Antarctobacter heliothermus TaxID=74033 RepID=A0A222E445_9RHOB|nr:hypothetical protein ANTHELSMS3_02286 [Antarctobacter heliothermus]
MFRFQWKNSIGFLLLWLVLGSTAQARVVGVEDGAGSGFMYTHRGNCFLILPTHLHGLMREGIRIGAPQSGEIGTAQIVYQAPGGSDISLALVRGGITRDCGAQWAELPRSLSGDLDIGGGVLLERARQKSTEGRQVIIHSKNFRQVRLVPAAGEAVDLFGGTSGAIAFRGAVPIAMVLDAESTDAVWATRMDEIVNLLARFMGEVPLADDCAEGGVLSEACAAAPAPVAGDPFEITAWSAHPVEGAADPAGMVAGEGAYVASLVAGMAFELQLQLTETDRLSRVQIFTDPSSGQAVPKTIEIITDMANGRSKRPNPMPLRDMSPDGVYENRVGERFAKVVTIRVISSWGGGSPVRIDRIVID